MRIMCLISDCICLQACCFVSAEALNYQRRRAWKIDFSVIESSGENDIQSDNWGIDRSRVSGDIDKCGAEGPASDGEDGCQRENRSISICSSSPHWPRFSCLFLSFAFLVFFCLFAFFLLFLTMFSPFWFNLHLLSSPLPSSFCLFLLALRIVRQTLGGTLYLNQQKVRSLVCKQLSTT